MSATVTDSEFDMGPACPVRVQTAAASHRKRLFANSPLRSYGRRVAGSSITPTPTQLRALTHPARLRMLGLLRTEGPSTATALAARLGINTGAASYHLRQLAQHGFITDDPSRGNARERWWQAAHSSTRSDWEPDEVDPDDAEALDAYLQTVVSTYAGLMQAAVEARSGMSHEWRNAMTFNDYKLRLTPAAARRLIEALSEEIEGFNAEESEDGEQFVVMLHAFPRRDPL